MARAAVPLDVAFWAKVEKRTGTDCWKWLGDPSRAGYGSLRVGGRNRLAHRVSYVLANGPIPSGMLVCHRCDNPSCVNPAHLFLGTHGDNTRDAIQKGRLDPGAFQRKKTHCPKGHEYSNENTRITHGSRSCRACERAAWRLRIGYGLHARKTHCPVGHEYSPSNTYHFNGHRSCRECNRTKARNYARRVRAKAS